MSVKIGLLLPRSVIYPTVSFDMMGALKWGLSEFGINDAEIRTEGIGIGSDDKLIYSACEKMLFDGCTVIAGYLNPQSAEKLQPLMSGANAIFLELDAGYHYPSSVTAVPNLFTISLQGALCCRIAAAAAVADGGKNFAFTCSFYEAGYRSAHAFTSGLTEAGGSIGFNHITPLKRADFTLEPLAVHLRQHPTDAVLASFCGDMLQDFCAAAAAGNTFENHSVYGAPMMGDEHWLSQCVYPGVDIKTCVTWASGLDNEANVKFSKTMAEKKLRANLFSLLGWETAQVIAATCNAADMGAALEGLKYDSPRGSITIDRDTHQAYAPVYECWVRKSDSGNCMLVPVKASAVTEQQRKKLEEDIMNFTGPSTSWQNTYGCLDS